MYPATNGTAIRLRPDLGVMAYETMQNAPAFGFIAAKIVPYFKVATQSADFPVLPAKAAFAKGDVKRAPGAAYNRSSGEFEAGHYSCRERGHEVPVDDRFKAMYSSIIELEGAAINRCTDIVLRAFEMEVATKLQKPANFNTLKATKPWSDPASDPKADIKAGKEKMRLKGVLPNTLIISWPIFQNLTAVKTVVEALDFLFPDRDKTGTISLAHLEAYLDIKIELAGAMVDGGNRKKSVDLEDIWSDEVATLACVSSPSADVLEPSIGRTFLWNEGASDEIIVEDYPSNEARAQIIRVRHDIDVRLLKSYDDDGNVLTDISKNCGLILTHIK
ncbi:MAG: hypothetical protein ACNI27_12850 [Desulfovibrio sp.]